MPIDNRINNMVTELYEIRQKKAEAEKMEKAILEVLRPLVDPEFDKLSESAHSGRQYPAHKNPRGEQVHQCRQAARAGGRAGHYCVQH